MATGYVVGGGCVELPKITEAAWAADGSTYYEKYSNGTLKVWGNARIGREDSGLKTVTFPIPMINTNYFVNCEAKYVNSSNIVFASSYVDKATTTVVFYVRKPTDQSMVQPLYFDWLAVGRWK